VAFSIFTKKGGEPRKSGDASRAAARAPARPNAGAAPQQEDPAAKIDRIALEMERAEALSAKGKKPKLQVEHGFQGGAKPAREPEPPSKAPTNSVMMMEVQESPFEAAPALEEAAILYANRQDAAAQGALEEAIAATDIPPQAARQAWVMLFDLFENLGRRAEFETAAMQFAVRFETSPPAFNDRSGTKHAKTETAGGPLVIFSGTVGAAGARQFDQIRALSAKHRCLRLDFTKVDDISPDGSAQLRASLGFLVKHGHEIDYAGLERLTTLLRARTEVGRADLPESHWLLLLDLYQVQSRQEAFEEAALSYCITYEVSPPSWVEIKPKASLLVNGPATQPMRVDAFYLEGEIIGGAESVLKGIADFAAERPLAVIDVFDVKRMDFIAAGALLNMVSALKTAGKHVEVRGPSPLLATLFVTMGFTAYARLARRRPQ
jgi:anti-anti-sigma regulatory factor